MPRLSVIMAVYNDAAFLAQAVQSILSQTFKDFEFIIINDGSTDGTATELSVFSDGAAKDARVRIISTEHQGLTKALNRGIQESKGEFLARMDADDVSESMRFAKQIAYLDSHPEVALCGTLGQYISSDGMVCGNKDLPLRHDEIKKKLLFNNQFIHSSWMVRRSAFDAVGAYDESFLKSQDYDLVLRIARMYMVANIPDRLIRWRLRGTSVSWVSKAQEWYALRARWFAITRYGYPVCVGLCHISIRLLWLCVPQRIKMKRYAA